MTSEEIIDRLLPASVNDDCSHDAYEDERAFLRAMGWLGMAVAVGVVGIIAAVAIPVAIIKAIG